MFLHSSLGCIGASGPSAGKLISLDKTQSAYLICTRCRQPFEDAVEAFKHIRDAHLKPNQTIRQSETLSPASPASSSTLEKRAFKEASPKRSGDCLVTMNKKMRVGN